MVLGLWFVGLLSPDGKPPAFYACREVVPFGKATDEARSEI